MVVQEPEESAFFGSAGEHNKAGSSSEPDDGKGARQILSGTIQFYKSVLSSVPDSLIAVHTTGAKVIEAWCDRRMAEQFNLKLENLQGLLPEQIFSGLPAGLVHEKFRQALSSGKRVSFSALLSAKEGRKLHITFIPLSAQNNAVSAVIAVYRPDVDKPAAISDIDILSGSRVKKEGLLVVNSRGVVVEADDYIQELTGYPSEQLTGTLLHHLPLVQDQWRRPFEVLLERFTGNQPLAGFEFSWLTASGLPKWSEVFPEVGSGTRRHPFLKLWFRDITERKNRELSLFKAHQTYKFLLEESPEGVVVVYDGKIVFANNAFNAIARRPSARLLHLPFAGLLHDDDREQVELFISKALLNSRQDEMTFRIITDSHHTSWVKAVASPIDWQGKRATVLFVDDISKEKLREEELLQKASRFELLYTSLERFKQVNIAESPASALLEAVFFPESTGLVMVILCNPQDHTPEVYYRASEGLQQIIEEQAGNQVFSDLCITPDRLSVLMPAGKLIKYHDGLFEKGKGIMPEHLKNIILQSDDIGDLYIGGISTDKNNEIITGVLIIGFKAGTVTPPREIFEYLLNISTLHLAEYFSKKSILRSEWKYRQIFESHPDIYFRTDRSGMIQEVSPAVKNITGYTPEELTGKWLRSLFVKPYLVTGILRKLLRYGNVRDEDLALKRRDESLFYASLNARLLFDHSGIATGIEGFLRDITLRKQMEEKYLRSEEKFRTLADYTYNWEYWIGPYNEIVYMSPSCLNISGYPDVAFYRDPELLSRIVYEPDLPVYRKAVEDLSEGKSDVSRREFRIVDRKGRIRWILQVSRIVNNSEGKYLGIRVSNTDITDLVETRENLKNSESHFRTLFESTPDPVLVIDYDGTILDANPALYQMNGSRAGSLKGKKIEKAIYNEDIQQLKEVIPSLIREDLNTFRIRFRTKAEPVPAEVRVNKIMFDGKKAMILLARDISAMIQREEQLEQLVQRAEMADMQKSAFLANMSHEIRTPMNAIIGFAEILSNPDLSHEEREEFIKYITQGGNTLLRLIEDIIDITKIEAGQIAISKADTRVDDLMDELYAAFLKIKNKNGKAGIELRMLKPSPERPVVVETDPYRLRQILNNLLTNALKFTREGSVEFGYRFTDDGFIEFFVRDTGIGIPEDKLDLIFERFGQVKDPKDGGQKGTGLGLSISRKLAEMLGGSLTVESEYGKGSTFLLRIPQLTSGKKSKARKKQSEKPNDWKEKTILIAEDSILNYTLMEALFQKTGVQLIWAKNGKEAVDLCRSNPSIDLVLMDIKMPVMNGLDAIQQIKAFRPDLPVVVQTAYAMPEDRERSFASGSDDYLTKPLNPDQLFSTVAKFLNE